MATRFTHSVGYRGQVKLDGTILLATSGQFTQNHQPIVSQGVWGAGYYNAAQTVAYSNDIVRIEGSIGCEYTAGQGISKVKLFAFDNRGAANGTHVEIYPDGENGFDGQKAWCTSLSFSMAQNQNLSGDMNFSSYVGSGNRIIANGEPTKNLKLGPSAGALPMGVNDLFPYWNSKVFIVDLGNSANGQGANNSGNAADNIMSWSANYNSSIEMLTCIGQGEEKDTGGAPLAPDYLGLGPMDAQCQLEIFQLGNNFDPEMFHHQLGFTFNIEAGGKNKDPHTIKVPRAVCQNTSGNITTGAGWVSASFPYIAIGDGAQPPLGLV